MPYTGTVPYTHEEFIPGQKALAQSITNMSYAIERADTAVSVPLGATVSKGSDSPATAVTVPVNATTANTDFSLTGSGETEGGVSAGLPYLVSWDVSSRGLDNGMVDLSSGKTDRITVPPGGAGFYLATFNATLSSGYSGANPLGAMIFVYAAGQANHYDLGGCSFPLVNSGSPSVKQTVVFQRPMADGDFIRAVFTNSSGATRSVTNLRMSLTRMTL